MDKRVILLLVIVIGLPLATYYASKHQYEERQMEGKTAPLFELSTLEGEKIALKDVIGKKVVLINFWATYCAPCQDEMPVLNSVYAAVDPKLIETISIMEDDAPSPEESRRLLDRFQKKIPLAFKVYQDPKGVVADLYGTYRIPETFLIGLDGKIAKHYEGAISEYEKTNLIRKINQLAGVVK